MIDRIRVLVIEDDKDWLKAIMNYLKKTKDIEVVGTATTRKDAIELVTRVEADVCLMDINLSGNRCDGIFATLDILSQKKLKIIMLTSMKDEDLILDAYSAGAIDYVSKELYKEIPSIIRKANSNNLPMNTLLKEFNRLKKEEKLSELSVAEKEVYNYIEAGHSQTQIEKILFKTKSTIKSQVKSILRKFNVKTSKEAIAEVNKTKLINEETKK